MEEHRARVNTADAVYLYGLTRIMKLRLQSALGLLALFPTPRDLRDLGPDVVTVLRGRDQADGEVARTLADKARWRQAEETIARHVDAGITPIAITDPDYPPLLRGLLNPPAVLFAKGDVAAVRGSDAVAVVGMRDATPEGGRMAHRVARSFAEAGFTVVAGLARGIDTYAHEATLAAGGRTVAVFATPLDRVYPAANRDLARRIATQRGALVSEYAIGDRTYRSSFKHRDRIQAGMSIAVIPIQTPGDDGTMHTVTYAEEAGRLLLAPTPPRAHARARAYAGIRALLESGRAEPLRPQRLDELLARLPRERDALLHSIASVWLGPPHRRGGESDRHPQE